MLQKHQHGELGHNIVKIPQLDLAHVSCKNKQHRALFWCLKCIMKTLNAQ